MLNIIFIDLMQLYYLLVIFANSAGTVGYLLAEE